LKRVLPWGECELGICPAIAEVDVMFVRRDGQAKQRQLAIDNNVMVTATRAIIS